MHQKTYIFHYSKHHGSLTRVGLIRLKVAVGYPHDFWGQFVPLRDRSLGGAG